MEKDVVLRVENVARTYGKGDGKVKALKSCTLEFVRGEFVAIIGKSGSGKSTLLRILGTVDTPDKLTDDGLEPNVVIEGQDVLKLGDGKLSEFRRRKIGFIFQDYNLFQEFTALENIIMPLHIDGKRADMEKTNRLMDNLGISHCKNKFPSEMSGGEQQRTSIARALVAEPAIILADEPTGNLDATNALEVAMLLKKASQMYNQTIIMVTHDRQMAEYADRIISIEDGVCNVLLS